LRTKGLERNQSLFKPYVTEEGEKAKHMVSHLSTSFQNPKFKVSNPITFPTSELKVKGRGKK